MTAAVRIARLWLAGALLAVSEGCIRLSRRLVEPVAR